MNWQIQFHSLFRDQLLLDQEPQFHISPPLSELSIGIRHREHSHLLAPFADFYQAIPELPISPKAKAFSHAAINRALFEQARNLPPIPSNAAKFLAAQRRVWDDLGVPEYVDKLVAGSDSCEEKESWRWFD